MKLNYLSRCIFSRICPFLLRNTFWLPSHSSTGTFRWLHPGLGSRKGGTSSQAPGEQSPRPGASHTGGWWARAASLSQPHGDMHGSGKK